jgi:hypothetical protein
MGLELSAQFQRDTKNGLFNVSANRDFESCVF